MEERAKETREPTASASTACDAGPEETLMELWDHALIYIHTFKYVGHNVTKSCHVMQKYVGHYVTKSCHVM